MKADWEGVESGGLDAGLPENVEFANLPVGWISGLMTSVSEDDIIVSRGVIGPTEFPPIRIPKNIKLDFRKLVLCPEVNTWYHLFVCWNDGGKYDLTVTKELRPTHRFPYFRIISSLLTNERAILRKFETFGDGFVWSGHWV
jgi:hypothetical protein